MLLYNFFISLLLFTACSGNEKKNPLPPSNWPEAKALLQSKFDTYMELSKSQQDSSTGWVETQHSKCDGTLFNGLYASFGGSADLNLARDPKNKGKFYRSPQHDCYQLGQSKSECSRDMYLGVLLWALVNNDVQTIKDIIAWGRKNSSLDPLIWTMCEGDIFRTQFRPNLIGSVYHVLFYLGGGDNPLRFTKQSWDDCKGFECHLQALHILIRAKAQGSIDETDLKALRRLADQLPQNALIQFIYARYEGGINAAMKAAAIVLDESLFPSDELPSSKNKCGFYLWERDPTSSSWHPCDEKRTHSGLDLLIALAIGLDII